MKITIIFLLICSNIFAQKNKSKFLNFEGIYETKCTINNDEKEGEKSFLRFYEDFQVISVATECDATSNDLSKWFNLDMEYLSVGNYKINNRKINFFTTSKAGKVIYRGRINKNGILILRVKSLINGLKHKEKYRLTKIND